MFLSLSSTTLCEYVVNGLIIPPINAPPLNAETILCPISFRVLSSSSVLYAFSINACPSSVTDSSNPSAGIFTNVLFTRSFKNGFFLISFSPILAASSAFLRNSFVANFPIAPFGSAFGKYFSIPSVSAKYSAAPAPIPTPNLARLFFSIPFSVV